MYRIKNFVVAGIFLGLMVPAPLLQLRAGELGEAFERLSQWELGDDADDLVFVSEEVVRAAKDPALQRTIEDRLIAVLESGATNDAKRFACRQLFVIGTEASVGALSGLLADPELSHMARYALEVIPEGSADEALREALGELEGALAVGVIDSIGKRGDTGAVDLLKSLGAGTDAEIVRAVFGALGQIPSDQAVQGIADLRKSLFSEACCFHPVEAVAEARRAMAADLKTVAADAYLSAAKRLHSEGRLDEAASIYEELYSPEEPVMHRVAAMEGFLRTDAEKALPLLVEAIEDADHRLRDAALAFLRESAGEEGTRAIASQLSTAPDDVRQQLLLVLGDRGDAAAIPAVIEATRSESEGVRVAAVQALGAIGDGSSVAVLTRIAASAPGAEGAAARDALARLPGAEVDEVLGWTLEIAQPAFKVEVIRALGSRQASGAVPAILQVAKEEAGAVRVAALQVLRDLADPGSVSALVSVLLDSAPGEERSAAENAVVDVSRRAEDGMRAAAIQDVYPDVEEPSLNLALLRVIGRIGADESLDLLYKALEADNDEVRDLAVRALADWPSPAPIDTVEELAAEAANATHRVLALRGFIRMVGLSGEAGSVDVVPMYNRAIDLAERSEEKLLVIARLAELRSAEALRLVRAQLDDDALRGAAQVAAERIEEYLARPAQVSASHNSGDVLNAIDGNPETRWATGQQQEGGEWFLLDFGAPTEVRRIVLDAAGSANDYPRGYEVFISNTPEAGGEPAVVGVGSGSVTEIDLPRASGRYVRIVQTGQAGGLFWSIHNIEIETEAAD